MTRSWNLTPILERADPGGSGDLVSFMVTRLDGAGIWRILRKVVILEQYQSMHFTACNYLMAASMISMIPALMLFVAAQRHLIRGVAFRGLKN